MVIAYDHVLVPFFFQLQDTDPVCSRVDRESLVLRYSVPHFLPNSGGIACWIPKSTTILRSEERRIENINYLISSSEKRTHKLSRVRPQSCASTFGKTQIFGENWIIQTDYWICDRGFFPLYSPIIGLSCHIIIYTNSIYNMHLEYNFKITIVILKTKY